MDIVSALTILHFLFLLLRSSFAKPSHFLREAQQQSNQVVTWMDVYWRSVCQTRETLVAINGEYPNEVEYLFVPSCVLLSRCSGCCNDEQLQCVPTDTDTVLMQILKVKHQTSHLVEMSFTQHRRCECRPKKDLKVVPARNHLPQACLLQPGQRDSRGCGLSARLPSILLHARPAVGGLADAGAEQPRQKKESGRRKKPSRALAHPPRCSPCSQKKRHNFEQNMQTCECKCRLSHRRCRDKGQELNEHTCRFQETGARPLTFHLGDLGSSPARTPGTTVGPVPLLTLWVPCGMRRGRAQPSAQAAMS
ncbi:vascular endothelial growth factor A-like [Heptranchias perlo]|uniref:vascular endothelial growth factor A-like n=1 Tax=Heptranchias perlo TaxID=212740 RepID=UPI00355AB129